MPIKPYNSEIQRSVPLSEWTSWKIGGPARWLVECRDVAQLRCALAFAQQERCPILALGRGSNILFSDEGFDGLVIVLRIEKLLHRQQWWTAGSGVSFPQLGVRAALAGYAGLEFAAGIPASVGGALFMNAGAQGQQTQDCVREVHLLWPDGSEQIQEVSPADFAYRQSPFQRLPAIITAARFCLTPDAGARVRQLEAVKRRIATQPYDQPSAGCVFRNPDGASAGALIEQAGCKGWRVGDAEVSLKHANFLINGGRASARDLLELIQRVQEQVLRHTGQQLHLEVRCISSHEGWMPW